MNTARGEKLQEIRQRIEAAGTALRDWDELAGDELSARIAEAHDDGVTAERERNAAVVSAAMRTARIRNDDRLANDLRDCLSVIETPPPPPAPEPMTIATMIAKLSAVSNANWNTIRKDLQALVKEQAWRDAEIVEVATNQNEARAVILKKAGLE